MVAAFPRPARIFARHLDLAQSNLELVGRLLAPDERERAAKFRHLESRRAYVGVRVLLRELLSQVAGELTGATIAPAAWQFQADAWGKPHIVGPRLERPLHFNLSKTRGRVLVAVSPDCELGCDIERVDVRGDELELARRYFHPDEAAWLARQFAAEQGQAFARLWTLKEAYAKARGRGLALGLDRICVRLDRAPPEVVEPDVDTSSWEFCERSLGAFQLAFACPRPATIEYW